jgi:hypothetical protein
MLNQLFKVVSILIVGFSAVQVVAQKGTQSPYSSYGIGELQRHNYAAFSAMGGVSMASTDSTVINSNNPASYVNIGRYKPVFQVGLNGKFSDFSNSTTTSSQAHFGLNQFQLGLPIKKNWGAAVGIKPYSFRGYTLNNYTTEGEDTVRQQVSEGTGGMRLAHLGIAYRPLNLKVNDIMKRQVRDSLGNVIRIDTVAFYKTHVLSVGFNGNYLFGTATNTRSLEFIPSSSTVFNARVQNGIRMSGATAELGMSYQYTKVTDIKTRSISLGGSYTPSREVSAYQELLSYSYVGSFYRGESTNIVDTIEFLSNEEGVLNMPDIYKVGFEYRIGPNGSQRTFFKIGVDVNYEKWSDFYTKFGNVTTQEGSMKDRLYAGVGLEWVPSTMSGLNNNATPFLAKLKYRIGGNYTQTQLLINNSLDELSEINDYGMSFGLGIPISVANASTNINLGANFGTLGSTENGLVKENYIGVYFGISITPGNGDYWFVKRKYD